MISVIVYGRNDDRGYGMAKRVATSINALAHVLMAPSSEILFVDYNTPDHLPTLPESISDTLTEAARRRLRVLRARPSLHARFADLTPLPVLEPIARNIALRRSRARNRWILSTNTDIILIPKAARSLEEIFSKLGRGSYGLPRFELPERAWEGFDRLDPAGVMQQSLAWGRTARVNEAVHGEGAVLFDGPGDFQLIPRSELFSIDGFDERMLLGWHVDHNIAVRLAMRLGQTQDLSDELALYHCGHMRTPTQTHGHDRVQNDLARFVHRIAEADCAEQRDAWGCPDDLIEEISLERTKSERLIEVAGAIMNPLGEAPLRVRFGPASFDNYWYDAGHVATHVIDLVSTYPHDAQIGFACVRRDFFGIMRAGLRRLGFRGTFCVPADEAELLVDAEAQGVKVLSAEEFASACDLHIFEFGLLRDDQAPPRAEFGAVVLTADETARLEAVSRVFQECVAAESTRLALGRHPRIFVTINAVHNRYEGIVTSKLATSANPFSTRLRYGCLKNGDPGSGREPLAKRIARHAGMPDPPTAREILEARGLLAELASGKDSARDIELEVAAAGTVIEALLTLESARFPEPVRRRISARLAAACAPRLTDVSLDAMPPSRPPALASLAAWRDPKWRECAQRFEDIIASTPRRDGWIWERIQIIWVLAGRALGAFSRILVVCEHPDPLVAALGSADDQIDLLDVRRLLKGEDPHLLRVGDFAFGYHETRSQMRVIETISQAHKYDVIVLPHSAAFRQGLAGLGDLIGKLRPALRDNGLLVLAGEIDVQSVDRSSRPDLGQAGAEGFPEIFSQCASLHLAQPLPNLVFEADAGLVGTPADLAQGRPVLGLCRDGGVFWPAVWTFQASSGGVQGEILARAMRLTALGEQVASLRLGATARREGRVIIAEVGAPGHVIFGPYLSLPAGAFRARIGVDGVLASDARLELVAEVAFGSDIRVQVPVAIDRSGSFSRDFDLPFVHRGRVDGSQCERCEVRLWSNGAVALTVRSVRIELQDAVTASPDDPYVHRELPSLATNHLEWAVRTQSSQ